MVLRMILASVAAFLWFGPPGTAMAGPAPFLDFQARRVKPPAAGANKRITVQIAPATPASASGAGADVAAVPDADGVARYGWFWDQVSPAMADSGPGRLGQALQVLDTSGDVAAPRLQVLQDIAAARGIPILLATAGTDVSPALVLAVIAVESSGDAQAVSPKGAQGLMQLMPDTAARFGVADALQPEDNIAGGVRYLDWLMGEFGGDPMLVLAGYNAGAGAVRANDGVPPNAETRDYVPRVLAAFQVARALCTTPPDLISDGCVFAVMN